MLTADIQRYEIMPLILNLCSVGHRKAHSSEYFQQFGYTLGDNMCFAKVGQYAVAAVLAYQSAAVSENIDLPQLSAQVLAIAAGLSVYFTKKYKQFIKEHQD